MGILGLKGLLVRRHETKRSRYPSHVCEMAMRLIFHRALHSDDLSAQTGTKSAMPHDGGANLNSRLSGAAGRTQSRPTSLKTEARSQACLTVLS